MNNVLVPQIYGMVAERSRARWDMGSESHTDRLIVRTRIPMNTVLASLKEFQSLHAGKLTIQELVEAFVQAGNASDEISDNFSNPRRNCRVSHISISSRLLGDHIIRAALIENARTQAVESAKAVHDTGGAIPEMLVPACVISGADELSRLLPDSVNDLIVQNSAIIRIRSNFPGDAQCRRVARNTRICLHYLMTQQLLLATAIDILQ